MRNQYDDKKSVYHIMLKTYPCTVTSNGFLRWQYTRSSTEAFDSVHNSFNVGNMYFLKLQSIHHQNYAIVNLHSSNKFGLQLPWCFHSLQDKKPHTTQTNH